MRGLIAFTVILIMSLAGAGSASADRETREAQARLLELGYDVVVDGVSGPGTASAIRQFQKDNDISPANGELNDRTLKALFDAEPSDGGGQARSGGKRCRDAVTATGYRRIAEFRAKNSAERAWSNKVATLPRYGLAYTDLALAEDKQVVCIKACAECTVSKVCTITAVPCRIQIKNN